MAPTPTVFEKFGVKGKHFDPNKTGTGSIRPEMSTSVGRGLRALQGVKIGWAWDD